MVNFDVLVSHAASACLCVDLQVVRVLHFGHLAVLVELTQAGGVHATDRLLGHLFVENIQVRAVGRLNGDN